MKFATLLHPSQFSQCLYARGKRAIRNSFKEVEFNIHCSGSRPPSRSFLIPCPWKNRSPPSIPLRRKSSLSLSFVLKSRFTPPSLPVLSVGAADVQRVSDEETYEPTRLLEPNRRVDAARHCRQEWRWGICDDTFLLPTAHLRASGALLPQWR